MNDPASSTLSTKAPLVTDGVMPQTLVIPVIAEQLHVDKQQMETGRVRLTKTVRQDEQTVQMPLLREEIVIERVTLNQYVDQPPPARQKGETTIYPILKEVIVIEKRLLLVEEIRVTKRQTESTQTQTVLLRREDIHIERIDAHAERSAPREPSL